MSQKLLKKKIKGLKGKGRGPASELCCFIVTYNPFVYSLADFSTCIICRKRNGTSLRRQPL